MNQTRRQFFKQVAATCAGIAGALTVAPTVVRGREKQVLAVHWIRFKTQYTWTLDELKEMGAFRAGRCLCPRN